MTPRVSRGQALAWRMERQLLGSPRGADAVGVVRRLCAVQAQVPSSAEVAIRVRAPHLAATEVARELAEGRLIRTWAMRGTLHLLSAEEGGTFLSLIAAARVWEKAAWERWAGITHEVVEAMAEATRAALDGTRLSRAELIAAITAVPKLRHLDQPLRESWGTALKPLAWSGELALAGGSGSSVVFMHPTASPYWRGLPPLEEAAPVAIRAYLRTYGPATADHFHRWLAQWVVPKRLLRRWWQLAADGLAPVDVDGEEAFVVADDLDSLMAARPSRAVRLLPGFDQWVLGRGTDDHHAVPPARRTAVSRQSGWISPVVLLGGVVSGTWRLDRQRVSVEWFAEAGAPPQAALAEEVRRLSPILGSTGDPAVRLARSDRTVRARRSSSSS